ncbi:sirohydrochlorin chelatase [Streptomyces sp. NPDC048182]|uniref:sirohydrochlorin chelatase n=1 Tax=Streptomyces sp. NPDC048182 TaxID=3365507 RepID=UPI0037210A1B
MTRTPRPPALVAVAHGSRDPRALHTVSALLDRVRPLRPGLDVHLGHIELNAPLLPDTLTALGDRPAVLVPLLLSRGHHVTHDIPAAAGGRFPVAAPLGPHPLLAHALHDRLREAGWDGRTPVVLAAAGSRDPDALVDTTRMASLLATRLRVPVRPATPATLQQTLTTLHSEDGPPAIASYFTAPGRFATQTAALAPSIATAPLGAHPAMATLILQRYDQGTSLRGAGNCATSHNAPAPATQQVKAHA